MALSCRIPLPGWGIAHLQRIKKNGLHARSLLLSAVKSWKIDIWFFWIFLRINEDEVLESIYLPRCRHILPEHGSPGCHISCLTPKNICSKSFIFQASCIHFVFHLSPSRQFREKHYVHRNISAHSFPAIRPPYPHSRAQEWRSPLTVWMTWISLSSGGTWIDKNKRNVWSFNTESFVTERGSFVPLGLSACR